MFGKAILFTVGSSALLLGCLDQPAQPNEGESSLAQQLTGPYTQSILHTGSALVQDEDSFGDFKVADMDLDGQPDLVFIKRRGAPTAKIEIHIASAASGYQTLQHAATPLSDQGDFNGDFTLADFDHDGRPDLVFLKRRSVASGHIEVHVLSAASGFQTFLLHAATALSEAEDGNNTLTMGDLDLDGNPDLVYLKSVGSATGKVELHALSAASGYQQFLQHTVTALPVSEDAFGDLTLADVDRDGQLDLVLLKRRKTGSGQIEVHALSAASGFQTFIQHAASGFSQVEDGSGDFELRDMNLDGTPDLVFIKRRNTGTNTIELHALAG